MSRTLVGSFARAAAIAGLCLGIALTPTTASAAPAAPSGLEASEAIIPTLSWDHVQGATQYVVELSRTPDVAQRFVSATTVNRRYVPVQPLPWSAESATTLYWRVAAKDSVQGDFSSWTPISRLKGYDAPAITSPAPGKTFTQPGDPATLTWDPVPGAQDYQVEISQDSSFTDPNLKTTATTTSTSYVVANPQVDTTYWFKVRARISSATGGATFSDFSTARSYSVSALPAAERVPAEPGQTPAEMDLTKVNDSVLDWKPVLGARTYDIQIATDPSFGSIVHDAFNITGTSYARPQSLNNDEYYWRVRARDVAGNVPSWSSRPTWRFERHWAELPMPVYPAAPGDVDPANPNDSDTGVTVGDPFYFEWQPVRFASMYRIDLSTDQNFSPRSTVSCYTRNTTYTPNSAATGCMPQAEGNYWWRITAMDQFEDTTWQDLVYPQTSQNVFNDARFTYSPERVSLSSPASGASVRVPTMKWLPLDGAAKYKVSYTPTSGGGTTSQVTAATSFTPATLAAGEYRWQVVPVSASGAEGAPLLPQSQRTFTVEPLVAGTASAPSITSPMSGTFARFPSLTWTPVAGAANYRVRVRVAGASAWNLVNPLFSFPAGTDPTSNNLAPSNYEWEVDALNASGGVIATSPTTGTFEIANPAAVTGQVNALTMTGLKASQACTGFACTDLRQTPVLSWDPEPDTGYYRLWVTRNANLSNPIPPSQLGTGSNPFRVENTIWAPTTSLQESNAGEAYYWAVQPCTADDKCAPNPIPLNSFNKKSNAVDTTGPGVVVVDGVPADGDKVPTVEDDVTLEWADYFDTNDTASSTGTSLATESTQTAREYEVQVATDHTFASPLETAIVDQRRFTSYLNTYPEGNIYWRVRAIDPMGNPLPWSAVRAINKQSPRPTLNPLEGAQGPTPTLTWQPLNFAASYELAVFPQGSNTAKITATSNQVKWSATTAAQSLSPGTYEWQVRRKDAKNRFGGWSPRAQFTISESLVTLSSPSVGGTVAPRDSLFTWEPLAGAADYRIVLTSSTGAQLSQITKATSWAPLTKLASGGWTWRVEPRDTAGVPMGNAAERAFTVSDDLRATQAVRIEGSGQLDTILTAYPPTWSEVPSAVSYQWYRDNTPVGDGTLSYTVVAADLGRKISLRATAVLPGSPDATSASNAITGVQGAAPVAATPPAIVGTGFVGETLTGGMPTWVSPDVTTTQRWLVNGSSVGTAPTFTVRAADLGKQVTFEVTGTRTGYAKAVVTSAPVTVQAGGALQATAQPTITGTAAVGQTLKVATGTWSQPSPTFAYQWLRTGAPIPGATSGNYRLTPEDAGRDVSVVVSATKAGFADGAATTGAVAVSRMSSSITGSLSADRVKVGKRVKLGITLTVPGVTGPNGTVQVLDKGKKVASFTFAPIHKGQKTLKLKKLKKGKHRLQVVYLGTAQTLGSKSKKLVLYIVK